MDKRVEMLQKMYEKDAEDNSTQENMEFLLEGTASAKVVGFLKRASNVADMYIKRLEELQTAGKLDLSMPATKERIEGIIKRTEPALTTGVERAKALISKIKDPKTKEFVTSEFKKELTYTKERIDRIKGFLRGANK